LNCFSSAFSIALYFCVCCLYIDGNYFHGKTNKSQENYIVMQWKIYVSYWAFFANGITVFLLIESSFRSRFVRLFAKYTWGIIKWSLASAYSNKCFQVFFLRCILVFADIWPKPYSVRWNLIFYMFSGLS
jgi:hypothetical protein